MFELYKCVFLKKQKLKAVFPLFIKRLADYRFDNLLRYMMPGLILALVACGGGGGGSSTSGSGGSTQTSGPTTINIEAFDVTEFISDLDITQFTNSNEYQGQVGLAVTKAAGAYARGLSGAGVRFGFTDTGLDGTHQEFSPARIYMNNRDQFNGVEPRNSQINHGTAVASVAAGARGIGSAMHGVAFNADIGMYTFKLTTRGSLVISDDIFNSGLKELSQAGTDVYNHSWGMTVQLNPAIAGSQKALMQSEYGKSIQTIANTSGVHVWSAGNERGNEVSISAALPLYFDQLQGRTLVVVATDSNGVIDTNSNQCGHAKSFCLAAPGGSNSGSKYTRSARAGGGYQSVTGTSFAAPHVSAALVLMKELFGTQMSDIEIVARLLQTTNNTGIYEDADVYGQGLLDIEAATNPVGPAFVIIAGEEVSVDASDFNFEHLDEDLIEQLRNQDIVVHDSLGTPFIMPLSVFETDEAQAKEGGGDSLFASPKAEPTLHLAFKGEGKGFFSSWSAVKPKQVVGLIDASFDAGQIQHNFLKNPYFELMETSIGGQLGVNNLRFTGFVSSSDDPEESRQISFATQYTAKHEASVWALQAGLLLEEDSWLGNQGSGVFTTQGYGQNIFVGLGNMTSLPNGWVSGLGIYAGHTSHNAAQSDAVMLVNDTTSLAFEHSLIRPLNSGFIYTRIAQPLRIERGDLSMRLPVRRIPNGGQVYEDVQFDLNPSGRQMEWSLGYVHQTMGQHPSRLSIEVQLIDEYRHNPQHEMVASLDANWRKRF